MSLLLSEEPDRPRFLRRRPASLWGDDDRSANNNAPFSFAGSSGALDSHVVFSTSLAQMARAEANADGKAAEANAGSALAYAGTKMPVKATPRLAPDPGFDVWMEAHYLGFASVSAASITTDISACFIWAPTHW